MNKSTFFESKEDMDRKFIQSDRIDCQIYKDGLHLSSLFQNDIMKNLKAWAFDSKTNTVFYRTKVYWYAYTLTSSQEDIICSRFPRRIRNKVQSYEKARVSTCIRVYDCSVGKSWLQDYSHRRIPLLPIGGGDTLLTERKTQYE